MVLFGEPTSAPDVSVQAQVLDLLHHLQQRLGLAYVFISHDQAVIRYTCDRVAVINRGEIVETGSAAEIFASPHNPCICMLMAAMPDLPEI